VVEEECSMKLERIWAREYANGVHFSTELKDGFTAFIPERLALAYFLRAQLSLLGIDLSADYIEKTERARPRRTNNKKRRSK
jgi:hypothetical protein